MHFFRRSGFAMSHREPDRFIKRYRLLQALHGDTQVVDGGAGDLVASGAGDLVAGELLRPTAGNKIAGATSFEQLRDSLPFRGDGLHDGRMAPFSEAEHGLQLALRSEEHTSE